MSNEDRPDPVGGSEDEAAHAPSSPEEEPRQASEEETEPRSGPSDADDGASDDERDPSDEWERVREARRRRRRRHHGHRKERILHTRVSEQLSEDIRRVAEELRLPVSNLVRNVLEETFSAVERMSGDVGEILDDVLAEAENANEIYQRARHRRRERADRARERAEDRWRRRCGGREERSAGTRRERRSAPPEPEAPASPAAEAAPESPEPFDFAGVEAWQPVVLASEQTCARTGERLAPGTRAYLALGSDGPLGRYVGEDTLA
jgi:hypothetical protein